MSLVTNVVRRGGSYYFRVRVPTRLIPKVRRRELWRSLRTLDVSQARVRAGLLMALTENLWSALDGEMCVEAIHDLVTEWLKRNLDEDAEARAGLSRRPHKYAIIRRNGLQSEFVRALRADELPGSKDSWNGIVPLPDVKLGPQEAFAFDVAQAFAHDQRQWLRLGGADENLRRRDVGLVEDEVDDLLRQSGFHFDRESDEFFDACMAMLKARAELWAEVRQRAETNWRPEQPQPAERSAAVKVSGPTVARKVGVTLSEGGKAFIPHVARTDRFKPKRQRDYEVGIRTFIEWVGSDLDLAEVTSEQAGGFMNALSFYPANGSKRPGYRNLDFRGRVERATEVGEESLLSPVTIMGKYLTPMRRMFEWYRQSGHSSTIPVNPFEGIKPSKPRWKVPEAKRRPFTDKEVASWLSQPLFTGSRATSQIGLYQSGDLRVSDWRYWLPIISLLTGARPSELLQLTLADIKEAEGVAYFSIRDLGEDQSIKSRKWRQVPIHSRLIELGLPVVMGARQRRSETRLFDIERGAGGYLSDKPSKFFNRMIPKIADPNPDKQGALVLYSTRHSFISKLRSAGIRQDESMQLVGHEEGEFHEVHANYGDHSLVRLREAVNKVTYDLVDWAALKLPKEVLEGKRPY
jgi:integrase